MKKPSARRGLSIAGLGLALGLQAAAAARLPAYIARVPLVAVDSRGMAVAVISRGNLEVLANGRPVPGFSMEKRAGGAALSDERTVFLLFDTLSTTHFWLSKAKTIAERLLEGFEPGIAYVLLSLEPGEGLRYVLGPTDDRTDVLETMHRRIVARQTTAELDSRPKRFAREDGLFVEDPRTEQPRFGFGNPERDPRFGVAFTGERDSISAPKARLDERKKGDLFLSSLGTLSTALGAFHASMTTVYFFSSGIAARTRFQDRSTIDPNAYSEVKTVDSYFLNSLASLADMFRTKGALVFVINPAGVELAATEIGSGEGQLGLLAERAGGRYLKGEPETIVRLLGEMEGAFYEVALPLEDFGTDPIDIEIRSKDPALRLFYSHRVFPLRGFSQLGQEDKMRLVLDAAEGGHASRMAMGLRPAEVIAKSEDSGRLLYRLKLPGSFREAPLEVFRVWLAKDSRRTVIDLERLPPQDAELSLAVDKKKGTRVRLLIVEPRSASALILP